MSSSLEPIPDLTPVQLQLLDTHATGELIFRAGFRMSYSSALGDDDLMLKYPLSNPFMYVRAEREDQYRHLPIQWRLTPDHSVFEEQPTVSHVKQFVSWHQMINMMTGVFGGDRIRPVGTGRGIIFNVTTRQTGELKNPQLQRRLECFVIARMVSELYVNMTFDHLSPEWMRWCGLEKSHRGKPAHA